jgi:LPPG:FO 2-phospho-L-lactate transferase
MAVAEHYLGVLTGIVIDVLDAGNTERIRGLGIEVRAAQTVMRGQAERRELAAEVLEFAASLRGRRAS